jgi:signal transduction histidine kinase
LRGGDTESVTTYLQEFQESAQQSLKETRLLIFELRPNILKREGLQAALTSRLEFVEKRSGLEVESDMDEVGDIPRNIEMGLYRIAQEALNNVIKHAQASKVEIILKQFEKTVQMTVQDNGVGFQDSPVPEKSSLGFQSMRERAAEMGAKLEISPVPEGGTRVFIEVSP